MKQWWRKIFFMVTNNTQYNRELWELNERMKWSCKFSNCMIILYLNSYIYWQHLVYPRIQSCIVPTWMSFRDHGMIIKPTISSLLSKHQQFLKIQKCKETYRGTVLTSKTIRCQATLVVALAVDTTSSWFQPWCWKASWHFLSISSQLLCISAVNWQQDLRDIPSISGCIEIMCMCMGLHDTDTGTKLRNYIAQISNAAPSSRKSNFFISILLNLTRARRYRGGC